jgi:uncharacterized protein
MGFVLFSFVFAAIGLAFGFLAQRSRMCFIAGIRDFILVRDKELLAGFAAFLVTIWILTSVLYSFNILKKDIPKYNGISIQNQSSQKTEVKSGNSGFQGFRVFDNANKDFNLFKIMNKFFYVTLIGGFFLGVLSVSAGGCVLRQHVLSSQGNSDAMIFVLGFYSAVVIYYLFLSRFFSWVY